MSSARGKYLSLLFALVWAGAAVPALADVDCVDFKWDVSKERALFTEAPAALTAGKDPKSAPVVVPNRLYRLRLAAQDTVVFSASPAKKAASASFAGLAALKIQGPGSYRVALDLPVWIDVVSNGALVAAKDFQGQHGCGAPHKIVEFDLPGARPLVLQLSNAASDTVLMSVTVSPPRKL
jgi:hypothetical protein